MLSPSGTHNPAPRVAALIPAYREERHIGKVVRDALRHGDEVWVVDDGSPDQTGQRAEAAGAHVIRHDFNRGKGASIKTGLLALMKGTADYVVLLDGDGQHRPDEIPRFVEAARKHNVGFVIGNRFENARGMPVIRKMVNRYMSTRISKIAGSSIPDTQCGFRLLRRDIIPNVLGETDHFDMETEMIFLAAQSGCKIANVPVSTIYGEEESKIHPWHDTIRFLRLMKKWRKRFLQRHA